MAVTYIQRTKNNLGSLPTVYDGELWINPDIRIGVYEQEISDKYLNLSLKKCNRATLFR